jgi:hypothetical protein
MKIKASELSGAALDWAVAKCEDEEVTMVKGQLETRWTDNGWKPSTDWAQGGPIIEREGISTASDTSGVFEGFVWFASVDDILVDPDEAIGVRGPTPLIAAMRCYVASKLGDEVDVPDELTDTTV